jgi:hypothetical protein
MNNDNSTNTTTTKESSMIDLNTILSAALNNAVSMAVAPLLQRIEQLERHRDDTTTPTPSSTISEANIEAMVERKVSEMLDDLDVSQAVEEALENLDIDNMVTNAVNDTDLSQAVEDALDNIDFNEKVDLDDLTEALKSNTDWASMIESIINSGSFTFTHR